MRGTLIGRGGHDSATTILPITVRGVRKRQETLPKKVRGTGVTVYFTPRIKYPPGYRRLVKRHRNADRS